MKVLKVVLGKVNTLNEMLERIKQIKSLKKAKAIKNKRLRQLSKRRKNKNMIYYRSKMSKLWKIINTPVYEIENFSFTLHNMYNKIFVDDLYDNYYFNFD